MVEKKHASQHCTTLVIVNVRSSFVVQFSSIAIKTFITKSRSCNLNVIAITSYSFRIDKQHEIMNNLSEKSKAAIMKSREKYSFLSPFMKITCNKA